MTHRRAFGTIENATAYAATMLGPAVCEAVTGKKPNTVGKWSNPEDPVHQIQAIQAVRLDRALLNAPDLSPDERVPAHLLAHAEQLGLDITWTPRGQAPAGDMLDTTLSLIEVCGRMSRAVRDLQKNPADTQADEALRRARDEMAALANQIVGSAQDAGRIDRYTANRLRVVGGTEA